MNIEDVKELQVGDPIFEPTYKWKGKVKEVSELLIKIDWEAGDDLPRQTREYSIYDWIWEDFLTYEVVSEDQEQLLNLAQIRRVIEEEFSVCLEGVDFCAMPDGCTMMAACDVRKTQECILQRLDDLAHRRP